MSFDCLFSPTQLGRLQLQGRLIRSATYEGMADADGCPQPELGELYRRLAKGGCAMITTGFVAVSKHGRAMQPQQGAIHDDAFAHSWQNVVQAAKVQTPEVKLVMQLAHAGRQTRAEITGHEVVGAGSRRCSYFRQPVRAMTGAEIEQTILDFGTAAKRARDAGFDGVQLHAAHGYLLHQFLSPWTNDRSDEWRDGRRLLTTVVKRIREDCGDDFPILVKLSWIDDSCPGITLEQTLDTARTLESLRIDGIEISCGSMEYPLNIIRGDFPVDTALRVNPLFNQHAKLFLALWKLFCLPRYRRKFHGFRQGYNLPAAQVIAGQVDIPVYPVGGMRTADMMERCVTTLKFPAAAICRPLIHDPDWPRKLRAGDTFESTCSNCNLCTVHCDSRRPLRCYQPPQNATRRRPDNQQPKQAEGTTQ